MVALGHRLGTLADGYRQAGHPLEITHDLAQQYQALADAVTRDAGLPESMPRLAQLVAASPLEAAIHDAYGRALRRTRTTCSGRTLSTTIWRTI